MPQFQRFTLLITLLIAVFAIDTYSQCGTLAITGVTTTPVSCNGGSDGSLTVNISGGTGPFTYSNGASTAIGSLASFSSSSNLTVSSNININNWWSPSTCADGSWVYSSGTGCPSGSVRFSRNVQFAGCFVRSPDLNMNGVNLVSVTMDVSHSYDPQRPNDRARFYCWVNTGYLLSTLTTVNGAASNYLYFNQSRTCKTVTVTFDLSAVPSNSRSNFSLYIETDCQYNNCSSYFMEVDNIQFAQGTASQSSNTFTGLPAGNYPITVQDANGCTITYASNPAIIAQPSPLVVTTGTINPTTISGSDGKAWATPSGGTAPYTFTWSGGTPVNATGDTITGLSAGNYGVTVTDDNGCNATAIVQLANPSCALAVTSVGKVNAACAGVYNGSFAITTTGANGAVEYSVNGGSTWQASNSFTGLAPDNYTVQVRDAAGCNASATANPQVIAAPQVMSLNFAVTPVSTVGGTDGAINLTVTGGSTPLSFIWSQGQSTEDLNNLSSGQYCVTVTDASGCTITGCGNVTQPTCNLAITSVLANSPLCSTGNTGSITITVTGATSAVEYSVNGGSTWVNSSPITGLAAGSYTVSVRDAAGCTANAPANPYTLIQPATIGLSFAATPVSVAGAADGTINLTVSNNTPPYNYQWSNGANTEDLSGLAAGQYCVTVTNGNACTATGCANVTQPGCAMALSTTIVNVSQFGGNDGSINLTATGGTLPYIYVWNTGVTTEDLNNLGAGTYCVTVTDASNCTATICEAVTQPANGCAGFAITNVAVVQPNCPGDNGTITVNISGGQNPILYSVDSGANFQNGVSLFNVGGGAYNVLVKDNAGCEAVYASNPITINTLQSINPVITQVGDTLYVNDLGADYQWLFGGNTIANATDTSYGLLANGSYSVIVTDGNGCTFTSNTVQVTGVGINKVIEVTWQLWPNPTSNIISYAIDATNGKIQLYGSDGRLVLTETVTQQQGTIDLSGLPGGVYQIRFVGTSGHAIKRIVKY